MLVIYILQMCNGGIVSDTANTVPVFHFSPHVARQVDGNHSQCISYPPESSGDVVVNGRTTSLMYPQKKNQQEWGRAIAVAMREARSSQNISPETCVLRSPILPCGNMETRRLLGTASHRNSVVGTACHRNRLLPKQAKTVSEEFLY